MLNNDRSGSNLSSILKKKCIKVFHNKFSIIWGKRLSVSFVCLATCRSDISGQRCTIVSQSSGHNPESGTITFKVILKIDYLI